MRVPAWQENIRINELSRWTAAELGVPYVDVAQMSLLRPDGAMSTKGKGVGEDCVHYCLPGPPDAFAQLAFNALLGDGGSREGGSRDGGSPPPESRGSPPPESNASAPSWSARGHPAGWLTQRGANAQVGCGACGHATCCGVPVERAESQPWWPFAAGNCSW